MQLHVFRVYSEYSGANSFPTLPGDLKKGVSEGSGGGGGGAGEGPPQPNVARSHHRVLLTLSESACSRQEGFNGGRCLGTRGQSEKQLQMEKGAEMERQRA